MTVLIVVARIIVGETTRDAGLFTTQTPPPLCKRPKTPQTAYPSNNGNEPCDSECEWVARSQVLTCTTTYWFFKLTPSVKQSSPAS